MISVTTTPATDSPSEVRPCCAACSGSDTALLLAIPDRDRQTHTHTRARAHIRYRQAVKQPNNLHRSGSVVSWVRFKVAARLVLRWVTVFGRANHLSIAPSHPGQLSLLSSAGREISTNRSAVMLCGWGVKARMAHSACLWITVWVADDTTSAFHQATQANSASYPV